MATTKKKFKWVTYFASKPTKQDKRVSESGWLFATGGMSVIKHFYVMDEVNAKEWELNKTSKHKPVYTVPLIIAIPEDLDDIEEKRRECIKKLSKQCDYYEKHGKWDE